MIGDFPGGQGCLEGPVSPHNYKRAVYRQAPLRFTVEMLGPQKQGGNYSYGMRIRPLPTNDNRASIITTRRPTIGYEVWRRWEDCLWFQETIEMEYERLARQKRQRLAKGKGVKKNGVYLQGQAASFESLPPGPDPKSIAHSIHDTIPRLSKKGTLFRASLALVEQRQRELTALIEGLFKDDVPSLIQELRESRIVTDFFGYWRRDYDLAQKNPRNRDSTLPRTSFSSYGSDLSSDQSQSPQRPLSIVTVTRPATMKRFSSAGPTFQSTQSTRLSSDEDLPRSSMSSSSSSPSSRDSQGSLAIPNTSYIVPEDGSVIINHGGKLTPDYIFPHNRGMVGLESLPEDDVLGTKPDSNPPPPRPRARRRSSAAEYQLFRTPSSNGDQSRSSPIVPSRRLSSRDSWMSGAASMLDGLGVVLLDSPVFSNHRPRDSISSVMTNASAEAIIPTSLVRRRSLGAASPRGSYRPPSASLSDDERYSDMDDDFIDSQLYDAFPMPTPLPFPTRGAQSRYAMQLGQLPTRLTRSNVHLPPSPLSPSSPPSPMTPTFTPISMSPNLSGPIMFAKAAYESVIVLLRISCDSTLHDVRTKMKEKFASQGVELKDSFVLYFVLPAPEGGLLSASIAPGKPRQRTSSLSMSLTDSSRLKIVRNQNDWEKVVSPFDGAKLTFRVMDEEMEDG